jgi:Uma2 family endonuclease
VEGAKLGKAFAGVNISDREDDWELNFRVPDVAVVLSDGRARFCKTHYCGGPDFLAEVVSQSDLSRDKIPFYGQIGVRELLLIDRFPWALELYGLRDNAMTLSGRSTVEEPALLVSAVLPLSFCLLRGESRPQIEVVHQDGFQRWTV